jgi:small subunit ribosomal protein S2
MKSMLSRELKKIQRNLMGIRRMTRLPGALVVIDVRKEYNAVREARSLGIPTVGLVDTDSDPDRVSIAIPGNDDAMRVIELVMSQLADAVDEGKKARPEPSAEHAEPRDGRDGGPRAPRGGRPRRPVGNGGLPDSTPAADSTATATLSAPPAFIEAGSAPAEAAPLQP